MDKKNILKKINSANKNTLMETLDIKFVDIGKDFLVAKMPVTSKVYQPDGVLHGGATAALAETVGSSAAAIFAKKENQLLRGVELSINHVRGVRSGYVTAIAKSIHIGKTMQLWKISIKNEDGKDVSFAKLTTLTINK